MLLSLSLLHVSVNALSFLKGAGITFITQNIQETVGNDLGEDDFTKREGTFVCKKQEDS